MIVPLTPELLLRAYRHGMFPMADSADDMSVNWVCPKMRGQLSIANLRIPKSLLKILKRDPFEVTVNTAFEDVIDGCAQSTPDRPSTWINEDIRNVFCDLHVHGFSHSVECWDGNELVGGVYGLAMGAAFFGESMFSRQSNASKVALVHLTARLWCAGFQILDTQFVNEHLKQFGVYEVAHADYMVDLHEALLKQTDFACAGYTQNEVLQQYLDFRGF